MIIITSLAPGHKNSENQHEALKSWRQFNCPIYSMNNSDEVSRLEPVYNEVNFIETHKTIIPLVTRPMISITAMIDFAIQQDQDVLLINSDIVLKELPSELKQDGITIFSRHDYKETFEDSVIFPHGFDVFFIPKKFLKIFPPSVYAMGVCWYDYFIPFRAFLANVPVYWPQEKYAFHKWHENQYNISEWEKFGEYFKLDFNWDKKMTIGQVNTAALLKIKTQCVKLGTLNPESEGTSLDIFYKTYSKDFWLLYLSLKSLAKNVTGYDKIIIVVPEHEKHLFDTREIPESIVKNTMIHYVTEEGNGYLFQQWCKISAYNYSQSAFILFADSDCIWDHKVYLQEFIENGTPEILFTDYEKIPDAKIWIEPTSAFIKERVKFEFMRRNCLIYHRSTLIAIAGYAPGLKETILKSERFSEFNAIGAYAFKYEKSLYKFVNTDDWAYVPPMATQLWSHGNKNEGSSDTHLREYIRLLETLLKTFEIDIPETKPQ